MKTTFTKIFTLLGVALAVSLISVQESKAQDFGEILSAGLDDANTYLENYAAPALNSFGNGMAGGWYNTAQTHKKLGVDLTISLNMAAIPDADKMFRFAEAGFTKMQLSGDADGMIPTLVGGDPEAGSEIFIPANTSLQYGGETILLENEVRFPVAQGFSLDDVPVITGVPTPTFNLGIGLIKNTDLKLRLVPEQQFDDVSFKMFGIGVMHDIKQWIPGMKALPFDLSGFFGTTKLTSTMGLTVDHVDSDGTTTTTFTGDGTAEFKTSATTIQVLASKKLAIFTPYIGIGVNMVKSSFDVLGDYEYTVENSATSEDQQINFSDPVSLEFTGAGGPRATIGGRLKLAILTLHFDYTVQKYNTVSAGIGISVR